MTENPERLEPWRAVVPVAFAIDEVERRSGRWTSPDWELAWFQMLPTTDAAPVRYEIDTRDSGIRHTKWYGFALRLYKDAGESYWANLMSERPRVFIVCEVDEDSETKIQPRLVTASQDEANAHMETDGIVMSVEMPHELADNLERFVVHNYVPGKKRKRKRVDGDALGSNR